MTAIATTQAPVAGQLVSVRNHRYVVTGVNHETLSGGAGQNLVSLSSVEDDAMGQELRVVWEIEPGTAILERASMPEMTGFDEPYRLDAFLNAVRWGAVSQADTFVRNLKPIALSTLIQECGDIVTVNPFIA